ncbi:MAG: hypothetical protein AAF560_06880, partial [Acidobacteriota bacterium]
NRWYFYVERARAMVTVGAAIRRKTKPPIEALKLLLTGSASGEVPEEIELLMNFPDNTLVSRGMWLFLKPVLDEWMYLGNVRPEIPWDWEPQSPNSAMQLTGGTFGLLGVQILAAISGANHVAMCDACGYPFVPSRKPQQGRRTYCPNAECKQAGNRARQSDYYKRHNSQEGPEEGSLALGT